jgi:hypothetical protein
MDFYLSKGNRLKCRVAFMVLDFSDDTGILRADSGRGLS